MRFSERYGDEEDSKRIGNGRLFGKWAYGDSDIDLSSQF
jgi:hypothetical protein